MLPTNAGQSGCVCNSLCLRRRTYFLSDKVARNSYLIHSIIRNALSTTFNMCCTFSNCKNQAGYPWPKATANGKCERATEGHEDEGVRKNR